MRRSSKSAPANPAVDPGMFAGVILLLVVVAALATFIPARRAVNVDPLVALKEE